LAHGQNDEIAGFDTPHINPAACRKPAECTSPSIGASPWNGALWPLAGPKGCATSTAIIMIRNGLYSFEAKALDGVEGGDSGTLVLRDGMIRGGTSFFYIIGTNSCSDGRWKGEMTVEEHTQAPATRPMARRIVSIGFSGTYTDMGAEASGTALIGKQSVRYDAIFRLLLAD
jgi:hypothetical protein